MAGVPPGSALETAISLTNLTALTRTAPASERQGCDPPVTVSSSGAGVALSGYVITAPVIVPAGTPATSTAGEPGTGGAAGFGNTGISAGYAAFPQTLQPGDPP
jgi:hypothetical protein